ncbi:GMC family oxidoreductase N-terminal domain-containing protein [Mycobacterium sp. CVI_P3]|uniref:GMC family oxidoreductase N-terminal domain-containing protein n=1 Tax=Mycobacterium pinniadriaticum TaxID=2994102 RepID=A0ABT3S721_9MYCO|nr:GMC family oxidoreductase N-terminal domain-containing protein [Mycobacterium pinniadriaticum]MCX2928839.1 GMC family oxidoreductase N-terminal domain-containing protein [Mycobacterium pinniadriaticum]MCX2935294.1 GMC family oxidoreductase N-terminal domain-containing protein [Mycobacterium pinniadriaticum]
MADYDYIVIGAGSAGCALAGRLAAGPSSVLLLEAGGSDRRLTVRAPLAFAAQMSGPTDWDFSSQPEPGCDGRTIPQPRGRVLGGTSSMNAMVWVRGSHLDYDGWQLPGWGWSDVEPVFRRIESHYLGGPAHGTSGPVRVTRLPEPDPTSSRWVAAARAAGVSDNEDVGGPDLDGTSIAPVTIWKGQRWNAARAYLPAARRRSNFTVVTGALVHRVVIRDGRAVAVEYERKGQRLRVGANREIVLSAGAYGTPQLLQLSGIGPAAHLRSVGIAPIVDSPAVGTNLTDHPATAMSWDVQPEYVGLSDAQKPQWLLRWLFRRTGKLTSNAMEALAHIRSHPELPAPDFQLIHSPSYVSLVATDRELRRASSVLQSYWTPKSRGTVLARSSDPHDAPEIRLNTLAHPDDVQAFIRVVRRTREIVAAEPFASVITAELHPGPEVVTDAAIEAWVRSSVATTGHPACSAAMGTDRESVLDEKLRVRGVQGLRVADASAFPRIPRANTNAPAIMVGERCADFVRTGQ